MYSINYYDHSLIWRHAWKGKVAQRANVDRGPFWEGPAMLTATSPFPMGILTVPYVLQCLLLLFLLIMVCPSYIAFMIQKMSPSIPYALL